MRCLLTTGEKSILLDKEAVAKKTVDTKNAPDIKLNRPEIKNTPVNISLYKLVGLFMRILQVINQFILNLSNLVNNIANN